MSPSADAAAKSGANEPATVESLGWQLRAALPALRLHSVSLYDEAGNILWLNEGALGPDEHSLVLEAVEMLSLKISRPSHENALEDGRIAIFLAVRSPQGALVGLAMILADRKSAGDGASERVLTPQVRAIVQKIAVVLRPLSTKATSTIRTLPTVQLELETSAPSNGHAAAGHAAAGHAAASRPAPESNNRALGTNGHAAVDSAIAPGLSAQALDDILEFELSPELAPVASHKAAGREIPGSGSSATAHVDTAETSIRAALAPTETVRQKALSNTGATRIAREGTTGSLPVLALPEGLTLTLETQSFSKLRPGGRTRRYEVIATMTHRDAQRAPAVPDKLALQRLLEWLSTNRSAWNGEPTSFTLNLSITTLEDERFPQFVAGNLKAHGIAAESIGFEIAEPLFLQCRAPVERFITLCDRLGCFIVIDDFSLESSIVSVLRSKALRLVKIDPKLTSVAMKDKVAQAMVVAIAQAVKVLGIHCAAKHVDSQAAIQWLTAIGCDFAQGPVISQRQPLESLASAQPGGSALPPVLRPPA